MLRNPVNQVVGHTDVEVSRAAGEDVDPEVVFTLWHGGILAFVLREKQIPCGNDN